MALLIEHPENFHTETANAEERLCRDFFDDVWARGNTDHASDYLDDHFHWTPAPGYAGDRDGYLKMVEDIHRGFPDLFADLEEVVAADGRVVAHWCWKGTHKNTFMGVPATGKQILAQGLALETVRNGRIVEEFSAMDTMQMMLQLGVTDLAKMSG